MCKAWKDERELVAIESAIGAWRDVEIPETVIKEKIMAKYNLTESEANSYMFKKSA